MFHGHTDIQAVRDLHLARIIRIKLQPRMIHKIICQLHVDMIAVGKLRAGKEHVAVRGAVQHFIGIRRLFIAPQVVEVGIIRVGRADQTDGRSLDHMPAGIIRRPVLLLQRIAVQVYEFINIDIGGRARPGYRKQGPSDGIAVLVQDMNAQIVAVVERRIRGFFRRTIVVIGLDRYRIDVLLPGRDTIASVYKSICERIHTGRGKGIVGCIPDRAVPRVILNIREDRRKLRR